jgi:serine/threonine protein kinase
LNEAKRADRFDPRWLAARIEELSGWKPRRKVEVLTDTTEAMNIHRGHVLALGDDLYAVMGNCYETRFGISDQPKYWVLRSTDLETGEDKIIKTIFNEEFIVRIGELRIRCYRSPQKESEVLELTRGDMRFMQGRTVFDSADNQIRILDFIPGPTLFDHILAWKEEHEAYASGEMQNILHRLIESIEAIDMLHEHDLCHGDIRNDHIIIDRMNDRFRWIDFDLKQDFSDFDVWSAGNIIAYVVGQGIQSFHQVMRSDEFSDSVRNSLTPEDASVFFNYRIMNLQKLFPYIPDSINDILMRFSVGTTDYYESLTEVAEDLGNALDRI